MDTLEGWWILGAVLAFFVMIALILLADG